MNYSFLAAASSSAPKVTPAASSFMTVLLPTPFTRLERFFRLVNSPLASRSATIAFAVTLPIPGRDLSSFSVAELRSAEAKATTEISSATKRASNFLYDGTV